MKKSRLMILTLGDLLTLAISFLATLWLGFGQISPELIITHTGPFAIIYLMWLVIFYVFDLYDATSVRASLHNLKQIGYALSTCLVVGIIFFYTLPLFAISPKTNLLINILLFGILFIGWRRLFLKVFSENLNQSLIIYGSTKTAKNLHQLIQTDNHRGYHSHGIISSLPSARELARDGISLVVIEDDINISSSLLADYYAHDIRFIELTTAFEHVFQRIPISRIDESWFLTHLQSKRRWLDQTATRISDVIFATLILLITSPLWIIIALLIKLDDGGKIFYTQERVGKHGQIFRLFKFRSMHENAESAGAKWAAANDPRCTRAGYWLRKLHLDELPQMLNVLAGDLSLVGPRPERPEFVTELEEHVPHYHLRHIIKPGFTGWAQIKSKYARSIEDSYEKFEYDLYYIKNRNLFLDLGILLKTVQIIFTHHENTQTKKVGEYESRRLN